MNRKLLFLFFIGSFSAQAQTSVYHPFPDSNAVWNETNWNIWFTSPFPCLIEETYNLFMNGDTTISGNQYTKLYKTRFIVTGWCPPSSCCFEPDIYMGGIRQDTLQRRVYYNDGTEHLLYDFNLSVGDTLPLAFNNLSFPVVYVTNIDSILIGSDYRKRYWLNIYRDFMDYGFLIEGIGSAYGLLNLYYEWFESGSYLRCFTLNQQTLFQDSVYACIHDVGIAENNLNPQLQISPNPATNEIRIQNDGLRIESVEVYDVVGGKMNLSVVSGQSLVVSPQLSTVNYQLTIDISHLNPGIYFVRVLTQDGIITKKLIKQ